ncbi:hypothetical protein D9M72_592550 [compost metagenome]
MAHQSLFDIMAMNKDLKLRIIFFPSGANDANTLPVIHFLGIAEQFGISKFHEVLDEWFRSEKKNFKEFASKYPLDHDITKYLPKAQAMSEWCHKMNVKGTPTFFINGYQLPETYNFTDFRYLF